MNQQAGCVLEVVKMCSKLSRVLDLHLTSYVIEQNVVQRSGSVVLDKYW